MTDPTVAQAPSAAPVGDARPDLAVLGMVASLQLAEFSRLAADASLAPSLPQRLELSGMARGALDRLDQVAARVAELGGELEAVMGPYAGVLVEFDTRTVPSTWWERLLKAYVGYGVADDFCRMLAPAATPATRTLVEEVLEDEAHSRLVVDALAGAVRHDATLASRLALWGRRLVGEALNTAQVVLAQHEDMHRLLGSAMADQASADPQQKLFALLTAEHSRRMDRLGLAA